MCDGHQFGTRTKKGGEGVEDQFTGVIDGSDTKHGSGLLGQELPGDNVRVVFHRRQKDFIPRVDMGTPIRLGDQVNGLRRSADKNDFLAVGSSDKLTDFFPSAFIELGRAGR